MTGFYRMTVAFVCFYGCSDAVVDEMTAPILNATAVRDMSVPSPAPLNTGNPGGGGSIAMPQGGETDTGGYTTAMANPAGGNGNSEVGGNSAPQTGGDGLSGMGGQAGGLNAAEAGMGASPVSVQACTDLYTCIETCMGSQPCADRCRDLAGDDVAMAYDTVFSCGQRNSCNEPGRRWNAECMADSCRVPLEICFGEPNLPGQAAQGDAPAQPGSCGELGQCLVACPANDEICSNACREAANPMSIEQWDTYQACLSNAVCGAIDHACRRRNCENEFEACFDRMIVQPEGPNSCSLYNQCVGACADNDLACESNCLAATSPEGYNQSVELSLCIGRANCADDDLDCLERSCLMQIEACFGALPRGMGTCGELNTCVSDCDDAMCRDACIGQTSEDEFEKFRAAIECVRMNCPDGGLACERTLCGAQVEACLGDVAIPMGQGDCETLAICLTDCAANDEVCEGRCIEASLPAAFEQFISYNQCLGDAECADVDLACRREACVMEGRTCFGAYPLPNGALTCRQFDECLGDCILGNQVCINACIGRASRQGFNRNAALRNCIQSGGLCEAERIACF